MECASLCAILGAVEQIKATPCADVINFDFGLVSIVDSNTFTVSFDHHVHPHIRIICYFQRGKLAKIVADDWWDGQILPTMLWVWAG